jgi:hypothetical protein
MNLAKVQMILMFLLFFVEQGLAQNNRHFYAYMERVDGLNFSLVVVNPFNLAELPARYPLTSPSGWFLASDRRVSINPYIENELWFTTIFYKSRSEYLIHINNLTTGFTKQIPLKSYDTTNTPMFHWSPDGRNLAILAGIDDVYRDVYVYSLEEDILTNLTQDSHEQRYFAWSPDGNQIQ